MGQFNQSLTQMIEGDFLVEAVHLAISLRELNLIATRFDFLRILRIKDGIGRQELEACFKTKKEMAAIYDMCFNFDGNLVALGLDGADSNILITEAIILIMMCADTELQEVALANFLYRNNLFEMLLESTDKAYLEFEINKELTLRTFMKQDRFKALVLATVKLVDKSEPHLSICLLDKIKHHE